MLDVLHQVHQGSDPQGLTPPAPPASSASTSPSSPPTRRARRFPAHARASRRSTRWARTPTAPSPRATILPLPVLHGERVMPEPCLQNGVRGRILLHASRASTPAPKPAPTVSGSAAP